MMGAEKLGDHMNDARSHDVLTLLALAIFADKKVYAREIEAFVDIAVNTFAKDSSVRNLNEADVLLWYENNRADLKVYLAQADFRARISALFARLKGHTLQPHLIDALRYISKADGEVHVSELALIALAGKAWESAS